MAPNKAMKRASSLSVSGVNKKCKIVSQAVLQCEALPGEARKMLARVTSDALSVMKGERHAYQTTIASFLESAVKDLEASKQSAVDAAKAKVDGFEAEKVRRKEVVVEADAKLARLTDAAAEKADAIPVSEQEIDNAIAAKNEAATDQKTGDKALADAGTLMEALKAAKAEKANKIIQKVGKQCGFDEALLESLPRVLKEDAGSYGLFARTVMELLEEELANHMAHVSGIISGGEADKAARDATLKNAVAAHVEAIANRKAAETSFKKANASFVDGKGDLVDAKAALKNYASDIKASAKNLEVAKSELANVRSSVLPALNELLELGHHVPARAPDRAPELAPEAAETEATSTSF